MADMDVTARFRADISDLKAKMGQVKKDLDDVQGSTGGAAGGFGKLGTALVGVGAALGGMVAFKQVAGFLGDAAQAAIEDEKSVRQLAVTMQNLGLGEATEQVNSYIDSLQLATGVQDDELRPAMARLLRSTDDVASAQAAMAAAMDISFGTGKSLETVANALGKAYDGNAASLGRLGLGLDRAVLKSADMTKIMPELNRMFGGQAAQAAGTYEGSVKRVSVAMDELKESLGYGLFSGFIGEAGDASGAADSVVNSMAAMQGTAEAIGQAIGQLGAWALQAFEVIRVNVITAVNQMYDGFELVQRGIINVRDALGDMSDEEAEAARQALDMSYAAREQAMYQDILSTSVHNTASAVDGAGAAMGAYGDEADDAASETDMAKRAVDALKASFQSLNDAISKSQQMDDFKKSLKDLDETLKGNGVSLKGMGDAAKENRDTLRDAFSDAAKIAQTWAEDNGKSVEQAQAYYNRLGQKIVKQFVAEGFKADDVKKFLGSEGIWTGPAKDALSAAERAGLAKAYSAGKNIGKDLGQGMAEGILAKIPGAAAAAARLTAQAEAAARAASDTNSPSKKWAALGGDLVDGLIIGMGSKDEKVKAAATETMSGIYDVAAQVVDGWKTQLGVLKENLQSAQDDIDSWSKSTAESLVNAFDMEKVFEGSYDEAGNFIASKFQSGWQTAMSQFDAFTSVLTQIKAAGGSDALIAFLQSQGITTGTSWGQALIDNGLIADMNSKIGLLESTATTTAQALVPSFLLAAQQSAAATYNEFKEKYGKGGPYRKAMETLMDNLARSLDRTSTITIKTVYEAAGLDGKRALGGPVAASKAYLVGERGPEVFVPGMNGSIIPNNQLGSVPSVAGGGGAGSTVNQYNITIQSLMGDKRQIGREVVEAIKAFERTSGPVYAPAST